MAGVPSPAPTPRGGDVMGPNPNRAQEVVPTLTAGRREGRWVADYRCPRCGRRQSADVGAGYRHPGDAPHGDAVLHRPVLLHPPGEPGTEPEQQQIGKPR